MSGTHFYLTLPSNASLDVFPDNKTTGYRVKLPQTIDLNGNWEVGLYSVSYPNSWYTLEKSFERNFYFDDGTGYDGTTMKYGHYETMEDFTKAVNKAVKDEIGNDTTIYLTYDAQTGKITTHLKVGCKVFFKKKISAIIGYGGTEIEITKTSESPHVSDLSIFSSIYIYCDIVQPQIVGDTNAQLLRNISAEGKYGDVITKTFTNVQYVPVQKKSFEDVEILLRTDTGDPVPFERGKVVTTLHFRKHTYFT